LRVRDRCARLVGNRAFDLSRRLLRRERRRDERDRDSGTENEESSDETILTRCIMDASSNCVNARELPDRIVTSDTHPPSV